MEVNLKEKWKGEVGNFNCFSTAVDECKYSGNNAPDAAIILARNRRMP